MSTLRYKENTAGAVESCQQPTCISLEDITNARNSKEPCKSKMAQIPPRKWAGFPILPGNFVMISTLAARKMTERCPNVWHFATLQHISFVADYTALHVTGIYPSTSLKHTEKEQPYGRGWGSGGIGGWGGFPEHRWCAVTCRPCNSRERRRFNSHTPEEADPKLRSIHVPPLTTSGLHTVAGMRDSGGCSMPEPRTEQPQCTARL